MNVPLDDETLQRVYAWVDEIPLSRPKKSIARDFSDGILAAEVVAFYFPKLVQMHNYSAANSATQKHYNWNTLNRKVLKKLYLYLSKDEIDGLVLCRPGAVEQFLVRLQLKIAGYREKRQSASPTPPGHGRQQLASNNSDELGSVVSSNTAIASAGPLSAANSPAGAVRGGASESSLGSPLLVSPEKHGGDLRGLDALSISSGSGAGASQAKELQFQDARDPRASSGYPVHPVDQLLAKGGSYDGTAGPDAPRVDHGTVELLQEKDSVIAELRETVQILEIKVQKLEQLVRLKDGKIQTLTAKLRSQKPQS